MKHKVVIVVSLLILGCVAPLEQVNYKYASTPAWDVCADVCPGEDCPCILGVDNTWYISPEVGE